MGVFVDRVIQVDKVQAAVIEALSADRADVNDHAKVEAYVSAAISAAKHKVVFHWARIKLGLFVGAMFFVAAIVLQLYADNWAAKQAMDAATNKDYKAVTSGLPGLATSLTAVGTALYGLIGGALLGSSDG